MQRGISCSKCLRGFDYAMGYYEGITQGSGCAAFVSDGFVYGAYGSVIYDLQNLRFSDTNLTAQVFRKGDNLCDYCISVLVREGVLLDYVEHDSYCPSGNHGLSTYTTPKTFSRLQMKAERLIREQIVHELVDIKQSDARFNTIFQSLIITSITETNISALFIGDDNNICHVNSWHASKTTIDCLRRKEDGRHLYPDDGCYDHDFILNLCVFFEEYPFYKIFKDMKQNLLKN